MEGDGDSRRGQRVGPGRVTGRGLVNGDKVWAFMSFASMCFLIFFFFYCLIQETLTVLQNKGKRPLRFKIREVKSQSLKRRGKITITL